MDYKDLFFKIIKDYTYISFNILDNEEFECDPSEKIIWLDIKRVFDPDYRDIFSLLHEIGHIETYKDDMTLCQEEFEATQWALNNMKTYNLPIRRRELMYFQKYIYGFISSKDSVNKVTLNWEV